MTRVPIRDVQDVQEAVQTHPRLLSVGGGSKPALSSPLISPSGSSPDDTPVTLLDVSALRGVVEYDPGEFTFTAGAATPVAEISAMLAERNQYLPFDPPFAARGATLGGTVATGLAGSMQYRFGGVRDFLIGARFVDGRGQLIRGGGKVVKNAAGFDLPRLMVGSLGRLGILTEVTFKVFPAPAATATVYAEFPSLELALEALIRLTRSRFDLEALDLVPGSLMISEGSISEEEPRTQEGSVPGESRTEGRPASGATLLARIGGVADGLPARQRQVAEFLTGGNQSGASAPPVSVSPVLVSTSGTPDHDVTHWAAMAEMNWCPEGWSLYRVPVTPARVAALDRSWSAEGAIRRYTSGAQTAWVAWPGEESQLNRLLRAAGLGALRVDGPPSRQPWIGTIPGGPFLERITSALDPDNRFDLPGIWPRADVSHG
ncbi:MAG: FAD-binding protein [Gemmatimonadota bacterium]|jgi:glycolate oxidase FAD binding subunit|nr:FAD-binding protein [Gemmatimonadota bacterium]